MMYAFRSLVAMHQRSSKTEAPVPLVSFQTSAPLVTNVRFT